MNLNITKQIAVVLFVPLLGALAVVGLVYIYIEESSSDADFINVAGRQRLLSEQIHNLTNELIHSSNAHEVEPLKIIIQSFDHSLQVLKQGGRVMDVELPPAAPDIQKSLIIVEKHWLIAKPVLETVLDQASTLHNEKNLYALSSLYASIESYVHQLTLTSHAVVTAYAMRSERLRQLLLNKIAIVAVLDLLLLFIGIGVVRRYEEERKKQESLLRNESIKQETLRNIINISLQPVSLSKQLDKVLQVLFEVPLLHAQNKGCIFLVDGNSEELKMVAHNGISPSIVKGCAHVKFGKCICGKVAQTKKSIVCDLSDPEFKSLSARTDVQGQICMPIKYGDVLCGVLNLYIKEDYSYSTMEYDFLNLVSKTLASMITNQIDGDILKTQAEVIDNISDAIASTDMKGMLTSWNKGAERMFGFKATDVLGHPVMDIYPQSDALDIQTIMAPMLADGWQDSELVLYRKNGESFFARLSLSFLKNKMGQAVGVTLYCRDISKRKNAELELACRIRQQRGIAELGQHALLDISVEELLDRAVGIVAGALQVEYSMVLELSSDRDVLFLKAGEGWNEGLVGKFCANVTENSQADYVMNNNDAVIVPDLRTESRFDGSRLLVNHGVISCMSVMMHGHDGPYGVLGAHTCVSREFTKEDVAFLRTAANILSEAIERKRAEHCIVQSEARFRSLVETTNDWIWEVDEHSVYTYASPKIEDILGYTAAEVIGKSPFDLMPPDEAERVAASFEPLLRKHLPIMSLENINQHKEGHLVVLETSGVPVYDQNGDFKGYRGIDRDITDRKKDEKDLQRLAHYDYLTGLPNRALFFDRLRQSLARAPWHDRKIVVMFLDLDRFKVINDTLGHDTGDRLLIEVAARLSSFVRDGDTVARLGGDEFAIILTDVAEVHDVLKVAQTICAGLEKPMVIKSQELFVTTSIGISFYPDDGDDSKLLVTRADVAMYHAKSEGRNNYQFYSENMDSMAVDRLNMETQLRHALDSDEYQIHYQPKLDLVSGHVCGMEALVRWMTPDEGLMPPFKFIPLLEDTGLIVPVGEWILRTSCMQTRQWQEAGFSDLCVSVNLSARQFKHGGLDEMVMRVLQETELAPQYLELEITESILMDDTEKTTDVLNNLHNKGVRIVIDDFGTGYSSLSYLKQFPISVLKIDRSFISGVTDNEEDSELTKAIIAMAHSLGIRVVAEGAETEEQMTFLRETQCDEVQGYHYSRPLVTDDLGKFLEDHYCDAEQQKEIA